MKMNRKGMSITVIILAVITVCLAVLSFLNYVNIDIVMIGLGVTQIASGLSQMRMAKELDPKGEAKDTKKVGRFAVTIGVVIIGFVLLKMILALFNAV